MKKYLRYKKDETIERKVLEKYGLGGLFKKGVEGVSNYGKAIADTALTGIGMSNVISDEDYSGFGSNFATKFSEFNEKTQSIKNAVGTTVLNSVAPGSGQIVQGIQQVGAQFNPQEEQKELIKEQSNVSPVRTLKCGGKLRKYQNGGQLVEFEGLKHEQGGLPIGDIAEVEDGETKYSDFIFSDSINYDNKKTFADQSKKINKKYSLRPNDKFSIESKERELAKLAEQQEMLKGLNEQGYQTTFKKGGKLELIPFKDKYNSIIRNNNGRIKMKYGIPTTMAELIKAQKAGVDFNKEGWSNLDISTFPDYNEQEHSRYKGYFKQGIRYKSQPKAKEQKEYTNAQADEIVKKALADGDIDRAMSWGRKRFERLVKGTEYEDKVVYQEDVKPVLTQAPPILANKPNIEEDFKLEPTESSYTTPKVDPLTPDWLGIGASAIPGLISGIGNLALANKVKYDRISPEQIRLQHLDPTRAVQEVTGQGNAVMSGIRQNARGIGSYLSNRLGALGTTQRATSDIYAKYDNANTEIDNREREINFNERVRALTANADIQQRELQDRLGFKAAGIEGIGNAATGSLDYYRNDKRFRDYQQLLQPDYLLGKVNGQTQVVPREWMENSMMRKNINLSATPKIDNTINVEEDLQLEPLDENYTIQPISTITAKYDGKLKLKKRSKK